MSCVQCYNIPELCMCVVNAIYVQESPTSRGPATVRDGAGEGGGEEEGEEGGG